MKMFTTALALTLSMSTLWAQDPLKVLPDSYSKQFENAWVRVVRVHYAPHAKLPAHEHNALPAAYVYLNDGGPVHFKHIGAAYGAAIRPATKAGSFRVFRGIDEVHEVENPSALPSHFLRVEFKTVPGDVSTLKGRYYREPVAPGEHVEKVQFENDQVRITRIVGAPGRPLRIVAAARQPALLIALRDARVADAGGAGRTVRVGDERWMAPGGSLSAENAGPEGSEFLRFDFKTAPLSAAP